MLPAAPLETSPTATPDYRPDTAVGQRTMLAPRDAKDRLIVGLDVPDTRTAQTMIDRLGDSVSFYKIGMQLLFAGGLDLIPGLLVDGKRVFLDMKLLDIDNTIANGVHSIDNLDVTFTTIHAYPKAMRAAVAARGDTGPGLLAVTVLTSMDDSDLTEAGYSASAVDMVTARARDATAAGMDGIVCSAVEAARVRAIVGPDMVIVTPGIRPAGAAAGDQKRVVTPGDAIKAGADYLVVARPVVTAVEPAVAARAIVAEIEAAL